MLMDICMDIIMVGGTITLSFLFLCVIILFARLTWDLIKGK